MLLCIMNPQMLPYWTDCVDILTITGKPYRVTSIEMGSDDYLFKKFRQACTWSSFTFDRNNVDWKYETFLCKYFFFHQDFI